MSGGVVLSAEFFARPALKVARELLGKHLCRRIGSRVVRAAITETEAYVGPEDRACHAHKGRTRRTAVMFGPPGRWYVYLCYGMHWMLNIVTDEEEHPAAVLFRGAGEFSGPGRLTRGLSISGEQNTLAAARATGLWIEDAGVDVKETQIKRTPRIGVAYAGEDWAARPYRFVWE